LLECFDWQRGSQEEQGSDFLIPRNWHRPHDDQEEHQLDRRVVTIPIEATASINPP
jgi:hypothetical protein